MSLDGLCFTDAKDNVSYSYKNTLPHQFAFKNNITFNRWSFYAETESKEDNAEWNKDIYKHFVVEAQLTDEARTQLDFSGCVKVLQNCIRNSFNMVVRWNDIHQPYLVNWLQPLEEFWGRSSVQMYAGS